MADNINDIILRTPHGGTAILPSGEFEGPVYITKPIRVVGNNTTIWAKRGSVVEITAQGVAIEKLRVELTEGDIHDIAIVSQHSADVSEVEILGGVKGFGAEDGQFLVPRTLTLGEFSADSANTFSMTVDVPAKTQIICNTAGLSFTPDVLEAGRTDVTLTVKGIGAQTFLYTEVIFRSAFDRRCYITGRPKNGAEVVDMRSVYIAPQRQDTEIYPEPMRVGQTLPESLTVNQPVATAATDVISISAPAPLYDMPVLEMRKGQRVGLYQYIGNKCTVSFTAVKPQGMDIDPYIFLLDGNARAFGDKGFVFFGNESSERSEVVYDPKNGTIEIDFDKIDYRVQKIEISYSIYAGSDSRNFSQVRAPRVSVSAGGTERISFVMDGLSSETTVVAMEFYLYKGEWKLSAVGAGYRDGMARLCNSHGIEVED